MQRKLVKQGQNALTVTLPAKWLRGMSLNAGDEIFIDDGGKDLILSASDREGVKNGSFNLDSASNDQIRSVLASAYKSGYDEIILNFNEQPPLQIINALISTFTGLEVVSQTKTSVVIKSFLRTEEKEVMNLVVKMFQILKLVAEMIEDDWNSVDFENIDQLIKGNVRKLRDHCLRTIHVNKYGGDKSYDYYDFVTQLEKLGADLRSLAEYASKNKPARSSVIKDIRAALDKCYECYLKNDPVKANLFWIEHYRKRGHTIGFDMLKKLYKKDDPIIIGVYVTIMRRFTHIGSRLMSLTSKA
ncbi:MAG: hypothetical protein V1729_03000 [Candidatus Woesearchaeota archaeon]